MNIVLQTPRLHIRPFTRKDTDAIFAIYSDEDTNTFLPWFPVRTRTETERVYEERYAASGKSAGYALAVCIGGQAIGYVRRPKNFPVLFRLYQISFGDVSVWRGY